MYFNYFKSNIFNNINSENYSLFEKDIFRFNQITLKGNYNILEDFKNPYFNGWQGFTHIRFNRYHPDRLMALHCDHIHDMFDGQRKGIPTLSVLGSLNNDYEGGEFLMFDEEKEFKIKAGEIMVFPSLFLYPHRVAPVTKGVRDTFVSWVW